MSLFNLKQHVSQEDFADAHEPLNDGVKEVPNAQTVAAGTKTGDVGTDTNSQGEARVIPEKEDTDDKTEKQFDTVGESTEKGSSATPAKPAADTPAAEKGSTDGATKAPPFVKKEDAGEKPTTDTKAPPFEKAEATPPAAKEDAAKEAAPKLEHDTPEANDDEIKKTDQATKSLEAYSVNARRFDIIGYPARDKARLQNTISFINRRSGKTGAVVLSCESITEAVSLGKARLEKLYNEAEIHKARKVSTENYDAVVEQAITTEPTAHGAEPLSPEAAAELTAIEVDPLDVADTAEMDRIKDAVHTLQGAQVAIEQHLQILRANPRISKQAAAVLQAGLEHIDAVCGLKVRSTGMESYLTTPRAACEEADVDEKSLSSRAGEIGAKIMKFLKMLLQKGTEIWEKFSSGAVKLYEKLEEMEGRAKQLKGSPAQDKITLSNPRADMFVGNNFWGDRVSPNEQEAYKALKAVPAYVNRTAVRPMVANLKQGRKPRFHDIIDELRLANNSPVPVLGGSQIICEGLKRTWEPGKDDVPKNGVTIDVPDPQELFRNVKNLRAYVISLTDGGVVQLLGENAKALTEGLIDFRKKTAGTIDESEFQGLQSAIIDNIIEPFTAEHYTSIVRHLLKIAHGKIAVIEAQMAAYTE